jgi:type IV pilus assembly protein PilA
LSAWYYAAADRQTHGPVERDVLVAVIASSDHPERIQLWQEGWPDWRPLSACRALLGLAQASATPPPLPPRAPPPIASAQPSSQPPGMSRKAIALIALIVLGVCGLMAIFVIALLAAIALPAYQTYTARAHVATAVGETQAVRDQIGSALDAGGSCPDNESDGFKPAQAYAGTYVESIVVGESDDGSCGLELVLKGTKRQQLDGKRLWWAREDDGRWVCSSEIEDRFLPLACRG